MNYSLMLLEGGEKQGGIPTIQVWAFTSVEEKIMTPLNFPLKGLLNSVYYLLKFLHSLPEFHSLLKIHILHILHFVI